MFIMPVYPNNGVQLKNFPTSTLGVVSKFDPSTKYKTEEEIENENGILTYIVGIDHMTEIDVELVMFPNMNVPDTLTAIAFNYANSTLGSGVVNYLIRGDVKVNGTAGKAKRVSFKAIATTTLP